MSRTILHVDMDAFYAAIEQRENPRLRGKPVVVGAKPGGRGVVSTASYEARTFGVGSAMPISEAYRRLPKGHYVSPRMDLYASVSREVMAILLEFTPLCEPLSLDEAFLDVTGSERLFGSGEQIALSIRNRIKKELRLTASVGIAHNKFLAKLASDLKKPNGQVLVPSPPDAFLAPMSVRRIFGIGPAGEQALLRFNIRSIGDIQQRDEEELVNRFGQWGRTIKALAHGIDHRPVDPYHERKSMGTETTFSKDVTDRTALRNSLLRFAFDLAFDLRRRRLGARTISLKVRTDDFQTHTRDYSPSDELVRSGKRIFEIAEGLLNQLSPKKPVRLIGISLSGLRHEDTKVQQLLFDSEENHRQLRVEQTLDDIREKFGGTLKPARLIDSKPRQASQEDLIEEAANPFQGEIRPEDLDDPAS